MDLILNSKFKWVIVLSITFWAIIIGLAYSAIGHADQTTEEAQTILTAQNTLQSTVKISPGFDRGSGFYIDANKILTNWHVVSRAGSEVWVTKNDGTICTATVGYREEKLDLAILNTECEGTPLPLADTNPQVGMTVIAAGNPDVFDSFVSKGIVSDYYKSYLMFDAFVYEGSSGGPLVNLQNEVVGVVKARTLDYQGIGAAVPVEDVKQFLRRANLIRGDV